MPTAVHFYRDILGSNLSPHLARHHSVGRLKLNGVEIMLNTASKKINGHPPRSRRVARITTPLSSSVAKIWTALTASPRSRLSVKEPAVAPYGMKQLYVTDPDGYGLCFQWPADQHTRISGKAWSAST